MNLKDKTELLYNGRRKAIQNNELTLSELNPKLTTVEKDIVNENYTNYNIVKTTASQIMLKNKNHLLKVARYGCDDEQYDGIQINKKEIQFAREHRNIDVILHPIEYDNTKYWYKTIPVTYITDLDWKPNRKTDALVYATDSLDEVEKINSYKITKSHIGYDKQGENIRLIEYGTFIN